jgi:hypothetical protein
LEDKLHALGLAVLAWGGCMANKAAGMDASAWAAWVQAGGSILAILAGFGTMYVQNRLASITRERERKRRAEVVAFRLGGWLTDTGVSLDLALKACTEGLIAASSAPPRSLSSLIDGIRLRRA